MREKPWLAAGFGVVALAVLACGQKATVTIDAGPLASVAPAASSAAPKPSGPRFPAPSVGTRVELKDLLATYKDNEVRGDAAYKGKEISITGRVGEIKKDALGETFVTLGTGAGPFEHPVAQAFTATDKLTTDQVLKLSRGDVATVSCTVRGLSFNVLLRDCTFVAPFSAELLCKTLVADGLAASCEMVSREPDYEVQGFKNAAGLKGVLSTMGTDEDFADELADLATDKRLVGMATFTSKRLRLLVAIDKTALQSEKDALKTWTDGL